jgi:quinoprotein glucose dehydrogenase
MPPSLEGTLLFPSNPGGVNWEGASYDSGRGLLIAQTNRIALFVRLIPRAEYDAPSPENSRMI